MTHPAVGVLALRFPGRRGYSPPTGPQGPSIKAQEAPMSRTPTQRPERTTTSADGAADRHSTGARAVNGEPHRKRRMGWLWWLLGLLALAAIAALLLGLFGGDDDPKTSSKPAGQSGRSAGSSTTAGAAGGTLTA